MKRSPQRLCDLGEDRLVDRLIRGLPLGPDVILGPGDDCAVLRPPRGGKIWQLLKTDAVVEGVHFLAISPPTAVGWKAAARAVSDIAAMGGRPTHAVVTVIAPGNTPVAWLTKVYRGLSRCARSFDFSLAGGETCGAAPGAPIVLNVAMLGEVEPARCVLRSGARVGDAILITGRLGGSLASGRHLRFQPRLAEAQWLVRHFRPNAMMDVSDGLGQDLPRLAAASRVGWEIDPVLIPRHRGVTTAQALADGEDFELVFTVPARRVAPLLAAWPDAFPKLPLTRVGSVAPAGHRVPGLGRGFEHFARLKESESL